MTPKRITYDVSDDGPVPDVGDVLISETRSGKPRSAYLVVSSRAVRTRDGVRRFALGVLRFPVDKYPVTVNGRRTRTLKWHSRAPKRNARRVR